MLEIPKQIWQKIAGYGKPQQVFRTNHENVLCWKAIRKADKKPVVIKLFEWVIIEEANAEIKAARTIKDIDHPNLIKIFDVGEDEDIGVYYVMEHWGDDLRNTIRVKPDPRITVEIIKQVLEGLTELHRHKMTHRDVKPENIFIRGSITKLGDYGLVKSQRYVTQLTTIAGTRDYMAPEIASGNYDRTVDIYSTGIVLRELLSWKRPPFTNNIKPIDVSDILWDIIKTATADRVRDRFKTTDEFIQALEGEIKSGIRSIAAKIILDKMKNKELATGTKSALLPEASNDDKKPIFQKLDIQRYPPKPTLYGEQDKPGVLIQTLQAQLDDLAKGTDYEAMLKVARPLATEVERRFGKDNSRTADAYDRIGWVFLKMANYRESGNWYLDASKIDLKLYGEQSREYLGSLYRLAETHLAAEDSPSAEDYYNRMLTIMEKLPTKGHPEDAIIRNNLGAVNHLTKKYDDALKNYQQALTINEKHSKADGIAINLYNTGLAYEARGNKPAAEPLFKRAVHFAANAFKPGDPILQQIVTKGEQAEKMIVISPQQIKIPLKTKS
ncbi:MAG: serine/threonine-protein kinase [Candidatus Brocadiia bacterium]